MPTLILVSILPESSKWPDTGNSLIRDTPLLCPVCGQPPKRVSHQKTYPCVDTPLWQVRVRRWCAFARGEFDIEVGGNMQI